MERLPDYRSKGDADMVTLTTESTCDEDNLHDLAHWHDKIELIRVITGSTHCVINGEDYRLNKDDICIINRQQLHMIYCDGNDCTFQRLLIDPVLFASNKMVYHQYLVPLLTDQTFAHVKVGKMEAIEFAHVLDRMEEVSRAGVIGYELELIAMVYLLFRRLFVLYQTEKGKGTAPPVAGLVLFRKMADFIYHNYQNKLGLDDIAASGNVSKSKCGAVFKEYAGHTPVDFLNLYRLKASADLLRSTDKSAAQIAACCGFGQQSYYNRLFLREYSMTPMEYRAKFSGLT